MLVMALKERNTKLAKALMAIEHASLPFEIYWEHNKFIETPQLLYFPLHSYTWSPDLEPWKDVQYKTDPWMLNSLKNGTVYKEIPRSYFEDSSGMISGTSTFMPLESVFPSFICFHGDVELASLTGYDFTLADALIAGKKGNVELGRMLVKTSGKEGSPVTSSLFMGACIGGCIGMAKEFYQEHLGGIALYHAACSGQLEVVRWLLQLGTSVNELTDDKNKIYKI